MIKQFDFTKKGVSLQEAYNSVDYSDVKEKYQDTATRYAFDVMDGYQMAGKKIRLAAFRHLQDLKRSEDNKADFPYHYDLNEVRKVLNFAAICPNVDTGEPTKLMDWQKFVFGQFYGWRNNDNGFKRFTKTIFSVARAQGKTYIVAIMAWYGMLIEADGYSNQDLMVASNITSQSQKAFLYVGSMGRALAKIPAIRKIFDEKGLVIQHDQVIQKKTNNRLVRLSNESGKFDSYHFLTAVYDEIGDLKTSESLGKITSGQIHVPNHQFIQISTAYPDPQVPLYKDEKIMYDVMLKDNDREGDTYCCLVWEQDELDEVDHPETWEKSNPLLGLDNLKDDLLKGLEAERDAKKLDGTFQEFQNKNLNMWLQVKQDRYMDLQDIQNAVISEEDFDIDGREVYIGWDASQYSDDTSFSFVFPYTEGDKEKYHIYQHSFIPTSRTQQNIDLKEHQDGIPYRAEARKGFATISQTVGGDIDFSSVYYWLLDFIDTHQLDVQVFCYDPWRSKMFIKKLEEENNWLLEPVRQGTKTLDEPTTFFRHQMQNGNITFYNDQILQTGLLNAVTMVDNNGIKIDKNKVTEKIDSVDATINAFNEAMLHFENLTNVEVKGTDPFAGWKQEDIENHFKNYKF